MNEYAVGAELPPESEWRRPWYLRLSAWLVPALPILIPLVAVASFYAGRNAEKNFSARTPMVRQIKLDDAGMRDRGNVQTLLSRYGVAMSKASERYEAQAKKPLTIQERAVHEWMYGVTMHPCPLPDDMLAIHADAILQASRDLVLVKPQ